MSQTICTSGSVPEMIVQPYEQATFILHFREYYPPSYLLRSVGVK